MVLTISILGVATTMNSVDSVGKPPSSREVGEVLLLLLEEEVVVVVRRDWRERNLGVRLGLTAGRGETNSEQDQKLHSDYLACFHDTVWWRDSYFFYINLPILIKHERDGRESIKNIMKS